MTLRRRIERLENLQKKICREKASPKVDAWVQEAIRDPFLWATRHTKTRNEHWLEEARSSPYECFPETAHLAALFAAFDHERIIWIEKSRDLMLSWACVAYLTLQAMKVPARGVIFQTQKADKVIQLVDYAKCLWEQQDERLRKAFPLFKPMNIQSSTSLRFLNGSYILGIPGGADQLRSYHPWGYLNDEASFQPEAGESYHEALSVVPGNIIFNSSAGPGWYADVRRGIVRNEEQ